MITFHPIPFHCMYLSSAGTSSNETEGKSGKQTNINRRLNKQTRKQTSYTSVNACDRYSVPMIGMKYFTTNIGSLPLPWPVSALLPLKEKSVQLVHAFSSLG